MRLTIPSGGLGAPGLFVGRHQSVLGEEPRDFEVCGLLECVIGAVVADGCVAAGGGCGGAIGCVGRQLARMEWWGGARAEVEFDRTMAARMAWMT